MNCNFNFYNKYMKIFFVIFFLVFFIFGVFVGNIQEMEDVLCVFLMKMNFLMGDYVVFMQVFIEFDLIVEVNFDEWVVQYYVGWVKVIVFYNEFDFVKKDLLFDQVDIYMEVINVMNVKNEEWYVLVVLIVNGWMVVDGQS